MTKQEKFLLVVQTTIIANAQNLAMHKELDDRGNIRYQHVFSATGVFGTVADAIDASERIPSDLDFRQAANDFISYMLHNLRDVEEEAYGRQSVVPYWVGNP